MNNYLSKILSQLIQFKTVTGDVREAQRAFWWIKQEISKVSLFEKDFIFGEFSSLVLTTQKTKKPKLFLVAHLDVVPGKESLFEPKIKKGKMFGRGAFDMKFAVACYLRLLKELDKEVSRYNFGVIITSDEEKGGFEGTKKILESGYSSQICFLPDGGKNWEIEKDSKSIWHLKVASKGKSAHGARPWLGKNAIEELIFFLRELKKQFPQEPCGDKTHYHNTLNIGKIEGGKVINKVAEEAQAFLDIRLVSEKQKKEIVLLMKKIKNEAGLRGISWKDIIFSEGNKVDLGDKNVSLFRKIAFEKYKKKMRPIISHGSSDARFFSQKNIPVVVTRPKGGGLHSDEEWIDLDDLEKFYKVMKEFVLRVS